MKSPLHILQEYWGFNNFRPLQEDIIQSVLEGRDTIALLPTGGGKSLCFQIPAMVMEGLCIVISPLVALMNDQVASLESKGIKAMALTGGLSSEALTTQLDNALYGPYKFLYLSPERLQQEQVQWALKKMNVNLIAVDEAHCISQWGNDFRPSYQKIPVLKALQPYAPTIALTATATEEVLLDTISELKLEQPQIFKKSFARTNLSYQVYQQSDKLHRIFQMLKPLKESAVVYVRSRNQAEQWSQRLQQQGISATFYHGGLPPKVKQERLDAWKQYRVSTMVATTAFGMGIDHPNVRYVIHAQLPESLESYFQEAGRAGRDGKDAEAVLLYEAQDQQLLTKQFLDTLPTLQDLKKLYRTLCNYFQIPYGEGEFTEHSFSLNKLCQTYQLPIQQTYNGLNTLDRLGIIQLSKQFGRKSKIQFLVPSQSLLMAFEKNPSFSVVGKTLLRMYGGIFDNPNTIDLEWVAHKSGLASDLIVGTLKEMAQQDLVDLQLFETDASITFMVPREDDRTLNPFREAIELVNNRKERQVKAVLTYIANTKVCLQVQLLRYFGETTTQECGRCSVCLEKRKSQQPLETQVIAQKILALLQETPMDSRNLLENLTFAEADVLKVLRALLDRKLIQLNAVNQYYCS
ncbi:MAG TPA: RecQ family ATP-dependent DNA helicase [Flavobacteriaceae bacterium]|nr:RecQ family ATP-dependent DNA helicase [Flavobacteriaceae bacterium]MCB9212526.1 RecQ family ATP-dependent DNA helicase [Alteromonas sp.]HPF10589.1 RecQ family ATP-dependent DNA helicase [Flavobacteriaceae bacterium]HQU20871.1 RecQ family ATP-dependent DNA helicase [Flavobacteriaceae bacterium]HQU64355.1 RecQ family ATP-dependent DNA helicase [Flavobacteriaceae bacterium]